VDSAEKLDNAISAIKPMIEEGLVVLSDADVIRITYSMPVPQMV
jgi:PII-like signaling protein